MKKVFFVVTIASFLVSCGIPKKLNVETDGNTHPIDLAKAALLENDWIISDITDEIIHTEFKSGTGFGYEERFRVIVNVIDETHFLVNIDRQTKQANTDWKSVYHISDKHQTALTESFERRGAKVTIDEK